MRPREVHMPLSQYVAFDRAFARHPVPRIQSQMCRRKERGVDTIEETKGGHQVYAHTRARAPISLYNKVVAYIARFLALARSLSLLPCRVLFLFCARVSSHIRKFHTHARVRRELPRRRVSIRQIARVEIPSRPVGKDRHV